MNIKAKRVALIIPGGIGTGPGNMGVPVLERQVRLLMNDFDICVFSLAKVNDDYKAEGFELINIPYNNPIIRSIALLYLFSKKHFKKRFDIVHGFWALPAGFLAVIIGKFFRIKSVVSVLGGDAIYLPEINYGQLRSKLSQKLVVWTLHNASAPIALTKYLEDNLKHYGLTKDLQIIPWGIDTDLFIYKEKVATFPMQFLHIGNLHPVKDQVTLLNAFKIISDKISAHLTIIGRGELKDTIKELISKLKLADKVTLIDPLPYESLPSFYHRSNMLLHTSLSEGQCEVVTEAMSAGVVVCGTSVGIMYDKPDCCVTVDVKNFNDLASRVLQLIEDDEQLRLLKSNAYKFATTHDIHWTIREIQKIYHDDKR